MWREQPNILHPRHTGTAFYLPQGGRSSTPGGSVPLEMPRSSLSNVNCCDSREQLIPAESVVENSAGNTLLSRYRVENERLRDQLKAHAVHTKLLEQRLHELSARNTALHLQDFRKREDDTVVETLKKQLEDREREVRALQLQVGEQAGRIAAFEEAVSRPLLDTEAAVTSSSSHRTHELLCQALSGLGFLTRVFNAVKHCQTTPHEGPECPRPLQECTLHCLEAAMKGNQETAAEMMGRGHCTSCEELALAIREEVLFCETSAVQIAAHLLAEQAPPVGAGERRKETTPPPLEREEEEEEEEKLPEPEKSINSPARQLQTVPPVATRATRRPTTRPTTDDCEVQ